MKYAKLLLTSIVEIHCIDIMMS